MKSPGTSESRRDWNSLVPLKDFCVVIKRMMKIKFDLRIKSNFIFDMDILLFSTSMARWFWCQNHLSAHNWPNTQTSKQRFSGEFLPLLISIFAHFKCRIGLRYSMVSIFYVSNMSLIHCNMDNKVWQSQNGIWSVTPSVHYTPLSLSNENLIHNSYRIFKSSLTLVCYPEDNYNSNSPLPSSAP